MTGSRAAARIPTGPRRPARCGACGGDRPPADRHPPHPHRTRRARRPGRRRRRGPSARATSWSSWTSTPMRRRGDDLKASVVAALTRPIPDADRRPGHDGRGAACATRRASAELDAARAGAGCIVSVGSGTITDLAKDASMRAGDIPFVVVQTAASVNAFSDDMAVLLRDGVKRTVPSRWPDVVIVDVDVLASTPARDAPGRVRRAVLDVHRAGRLVPRPRHGHGRRLRRRGRRAVPRRRRRPPRVGVADAHDRRRSGDARGAGRPDGPDRHRDGRGGSDRAAVRHRAPRSATCSTWTPRPADARSAFHGAQVGVASVLAATLWHDTLDRFDPERPRSTTHRVPTRRTSSGGSATAFDPIDPSGQHGGRVLARRPAQARSLAVATRTRSKRSSPTGIAIGRRSEALVATPDRLRDRAASRRARRRRSPSSTRRRPRRSCAGRSRRSR